MRKSLASRVMSKATTFVVLTLLIVMGLSINLSATHADNLSLSTTTNCDANAVIYCGASSTDSLIDKYMNGDGNNSAASIQHIYRYFGIRSSDIQAMSTSNSTETVETGSVTKDGNVYDASHKLLARDAITAGRENISGSTAETYDGTSFYVRSPRVSFVSDTLAAYIVLINNKFQYAILGSCGNPVTATAVPAPTLVPTPTPKTPTPAAPTTETPPPTSTTMNNVIYNTVTVTPQPASQPTQQPLSVAAPAALVNTGPGDVLALFVGTFLISTIVYQVLIRRKVSQY